MEENKQLIKRLERSMDKSYIKDGVHILDNLPRKQNKLANNLFQSRI